uniref:Uncharacterized protein n=1 Tax=Manihot esculenta TaxID=3983 RepID=A0A199U9J6_MANES
MDSHSGGGGDVVMSYGQLSSQSKCGGYILYLINNQVVTRLWDLSEYYPMHGKKKVASDSLSSSLT